MKPPRAWEILREFKESCRNEGWITSENEDWIKAGDNYHNFLWAKNIHPSSFKRIASNKKCIVREGLGYQVVEAFYTAWLFSEAPPEIVVKMVIEDPNLSSHVAIYDLSPMAKGKNVVTKLNCTNNMIFKQFEEFLKNKLGIKLKSVPTPPDLQVNAEDCTVTQLP